MRPTLTITGVHGHSSSRSCYTSWEESPVEGRGLPRTRFAHLVQVSKQWEVDDREGDIPDKDWNKQTMFKIRCTKIKLDEKFSKWRRKDFHLPHHGCPQTFVKTWNALSLEELPCNLDGRCSSGHCNYCTRVVGPTQHGVGDHKLCGRHLDWLLLLCSCDQTNNHHL